VTAEDLVKWVELEGDVEVLPDQEPALYTTSPLRAKTPELHLDEVKEQLVEKISSALPAQFE
jgi:hypothetical protein